MSRLKNLVLFAGVGYLVYTFALGGGSVLAGGKDLHARNDLVGESAPPLSVEQWLTPEPDPAGRMVLVDFWATWCPPCRAAIPKLNEWSRQFHDRLLVVGLSDESPQQVQQMPGPRIEYASAIDTQGRMKSAVGVEGIPHVLLVDPQGVVRWQGFPFEPGHELTTEVIQALLDEHVPRG